MSQLPHDPVIDEVREVRHRISQRFGHDPAKLIAHYMQMQKGCGRRIIYAPAVQDQYTSESPRSTPARAEGSYRVAGLHSHATQTSPDFDVTLPDESRE